jgi:hypothetical protein
MFHSETKMFYSETNFFKITTIILLQTHSVWSKQGKYLTGTPNVAIKTPNL